MNICTIIQYIVAVVELILRRNTFTVTEGDPGFDSSVLIFVDFVNPMIGQQMVDLNFTVSSTATSMYQLKFVYENLTTCPVAA